MHFSQHSMGSFSVLRQGLATYVVQTSLQLVPPNSGSKVLGLKLCLTKGQMLYSAFIPNLFSKLRLKLRGNKVTFTPFQVPSAFNSRKQAIKREIQQGSSVINTFLQVKYCEMASLY